MGTPLFEEYLSKNVKKAKGVSLKIFVGRAW
jgi:hypothetical protein